MSDVERHISRSERPDVGQAAGANLTHLDVAMITRRGSVERTANYSFARARAISARVHGGRLPI